MQKLESKKAIEFVLAEYPKLNKSRLARMLGVTPQAVNNYLTYGSKVSQVVADKIAMNFDIEITDCTYMNRVPTMEDLK